MKGKFGLVVIVFSICFISLIDYGSAQSVVNSLHNMSVSSPGKSKATSEQQVCIFCHTSHSSQPKGPLWNRKQTGANYILYDNTISNTFQALPGQPDGSSVLCLSCHDGTTALGKIASRVREINFGANSGKIKGRNNLGTDLSDDHPVSFVYDASLAATDGQLKFPPEHPVKLDGNSKLQCISCHEPHNNQNKKFLVVTNQYSQLCFTCHDRNYWTTSSHSTSTKNWNGAGRNPWGHIEDPYATVAENGCENCHNNHNANGKTRLLKSALEENNCLDCHNGNVASNNIETEVNKIYSHNVYNYNGIHNPLENNIPSAIHVECIDCHNPHAVNDKNANAPYAKGSIFGVKGVDQSGIAIENIQYEYELCYRCHSEKPATASRLARQLEQSNVRLEFEPTNPSFHPVNGVGRNNSVPSLISPLSESSVIYCTSCHSSNGSSAPAGPHGSIYPAILKFRYETKDNTVESYSAYELCYSCHDRNSIMNNESFSYHEQHVKGQNTPCSVCHDPHGISSTQGNDMNNTHLINFDRNVVSPDLTGQMQFYDNGSGSGYCLLKCHGKTHDISLSY